MQKNKFHLLANKVDIDAIFFMIEISSIHSVNFESPLCLLGIKISRGKRPNGLVPDELWVSFILLEVSVYWHRGAYDGVFLFLFLSELGDDLP